MLTLYRKLAYLFLMGALYFGSLYLIMGNYQAFSSTMKTATAYGAQQSDLKIIKGVIKNGDTATTLLRSYLPLKTIYEISGFTHNNFSLSHIKKGQSYKICLQEDTLLFFEYEIDRQTKFVAQNTPQGIILKQEPIKYDVQLETVSAVINNSLFESVKASGERTELAFKLSEIFAWDIDFIRDIRPGDTFKILVEKKYRKGKLSGYGRIQAAFFTNQNTLYKAFLYTDSNGVSGYYDAKGRSVQKAFLKSPLTFSRISSGFTMRRMHPIFKEYRPHPGVDYAAPTGTPIKTVGDGQIIQIGYNKGFGKYIKVRHNNGYVTCYNHMSRFAKSMKKNRKVSQGDTIGYVGSTGWSTGPHLDFRMIKNGRLINPLKHKSPPTKPVSDKEMASFLEKTRKLTNKLLAALKQPLPKKKMS